MTRALVQFYRAFFISRGRFNGGDDINQVTMLPDKMKTELALHVHLETLRKVNRFVYFLEQQIFVMHQLWLTLVSCSGYAKLQNFICL